MRLGSIKLMALASVLTAVAGCQTGPRLAKQKLTFFPASPSKSRIQFLTAVNGAEDVEPPGRGFDSWILGDEPRQQLLLDKPYGVAARDGAVYVCDTKGLALIKLDFREESFSVIGADGQGRLRKPINVVIDAIGYKFVTDPVRKQVVVFGPDDSYVTSFNMPEPCRPVDLAVTDTKIYVLDNDKTPQIVVFDRVSGEVVRTFGRGGVEPGEFHFPSSIALDPKGEHLYVSDTMNWRIQKLTTDGDPVESFGEKGCIGMPGYRLGQFGRPRGIRVDSDGIVYVVDGATEIVQMFSSAGELLMRFGGPGNKPGSLVLPSSLAIDETSIGQFSDLIHEEFRAERLLFVASQYGDRLISVYALGSFPDGFTLSAAEIATISPIAPKMPPEAADKTPRGN